MRKEILKKIGEMGDGVSFVDLTRNIEGFSGEYMYGSPETKIYFWFACSEDAINSLTELINSGEIIVKSCNFLLYHADGIIPNYPLATCVRRYAKPRWFPVVFYKA